MTASTSGRRDLILAIGGCVAAAAAMLLGAGQEWLHASLSARPPLPSVSQTFTGGDVVDVLVPLGILVGAAGLALIAARKIGRLIVGVVVLAAGLLVTTAVGYFLYDDGIIAATSWAQGYVTSAESLFPRRDLSRLPAVIALAGGVIAVAVGILVMVSSRRWPMMGARYERRSDSASASAEAGTPAAPTGSADAEAAPASETAMWAAMQRGEDPTAAR